MASPVDSARQGTNITTAATSHAINVGSPAAGTLLIVLVRFAGAPGTVTFTGYTQFAADTSDASDDDTRLYYRQADGSEGATDTLSTTNSVKLAAISWEITGAENPATTAPSVSSVVIGTAANINPNAIPAVTIIDFLTTAGGFTNLFGDGSGSNERLGQSFLAPDSSIITVGLTLSTGGTPIDNLIIEIQGDNAGEPDGTALVTVATLIAANLTSSATNYEWSVSLSGLTVSAKYWIVIRRSSSDAVQGFTVHGATGSYASGERKVRTGGAWGAALSDASFKVVGGVGLPSRDYLFITVIGMDSETATATQPAGYSNLASANSGTGGAVATNCMIWGASKQATATSEDPGAWTSSAPNSGVTAWTIAIPPPAVAAAPGPTAAFFKPPLRRRASRYLTFR